MYIDKTAQVFRLASEGKYYFLSRPRRFGKSLLLSTLEAYFQGRRELFQGLAIEALEKEWTEYPVLRLDLGGEVYNAMDVLENKLGQTLEVWEQMYGIGKIPPSVSSRFTEVISAAVRKTGRKVVVLVDEYEKPIVDNLGNKELKEHFRSTLQGFYSVIKSQDSNIRFAFLTGVSRIGHMSIFSGLNNLNDISMDAPYADICGISEKELRDFLDDGVRAMAAANGISTEECYERLKRMYDGYHFCHGSIGVYNPFSLLLAMSKKEFGEYWYSTATPSFLVSFLMQENVNLNDLTLDHVRPRILTGTNAEIISPVTLLYQTGYLTIREYFPDTNEYLLGWPNREVESGFTESLAQLYIPKEEEVSEFSVNRFSQDLRNGDPEIFMQRLKAFMADNDYHVQGKAELYMQNTMYVFLKLLGQRVEVERHTANGRIDILIQTDRFVYIIELKRDKDPGNALDQIETKGYEWPFQADSRKVTPLFRHVDDLAVLQFVGYADALAFLAGPGLVLRGGIAVDGLSLLDDYLHILLARVLYHRKILRGEHLCHVVACDKGDHQGHGEDHGHIEQVADNAHRVVLLPVSQKPSPLHRTSSPAFIDSPSAESGLTPAVSPTEADCCRCPAQPANPAQPSSTSDTNSSRFRSRVYHLCLTCCVMKPIAAENSPTTVVAKATCML